MPLDQRELRNALGGFCTGVTVVTTRTRTDERLLGVTVNSFNAVSLEPPLVLFSLDRRASALAAIEAAGRFAVNVLAHDQEALCQRFARPVGDDFAGLDYEQWTTGAPILAGCVSNFDCRTWRVYDGGDHRIFLGEVIQLRTRPELSPMLFYRGRFPSLHGDG